MVKIPRQQKYDDSAEELTQEKIDGGQGNDFK